MKKLMAEIIIIHLTIGPSLARLALEIVMERMGLIHMYINGIYRQDRDSLQIGTQQISRVLLVENDPGKAVGPRKGIYEYELKKTCLILLISFGQCNLSNRQIEDANNCFPPF